MLRAERSWSQQDLAERLEVSRQSVNAIETGKYDPSLPLAFRIAELFDRPIEDIFVSPSRHIPKPSDLQTQENIHASSCAFILAGLAAATLDWSAPGQAQPPAAAQQKPGRITIRSVGQGTPVVLIPGLASPPAVWDDLAEKIGTRHRLIFVQVNGFGGSKPGMDPQDGLLPGAVDELAGWLAANHIAKPAVIGHSMGGLLGMMLAKAHPAAVGKLMIVDSLPFFGMLMGPGATPETVRPMAEQMRASLLKAPASSEPPPHMSNTDAGRARSPRGCARRTRRSSAKRWSKTRPPTSAPTCPRSRHSRDRALRRAERRA